MNNQQIIDLINGLIFITIEISLPLLGVALIVGLLVSIFQAATQINEATLSFLPKIGAILLLMVILSPWMVRQLSDYTKRIYSKIELVGTTKSN